jgi:hypothetical protein
MYFLGHPLWVNFEKTVLDMNPVFGSGSGIRSLLTPDPGSEIGFFQIPDIGSQTYIFESLVTIFGVKSSIILCKFAQIISSPVQKSNNFQFCDICGYKNRYDIHPSLLLLLLNLGSEMDKKRIQDPGSATLRESHDGGACER